MVDYSKWDSLDVSDDEERPRPHVSKFDTPQTVTIGRQEGAQTAPVAPVGDVDMEDADDDEPFETEDDAAEPGEDRREDVLQCRALAERALRNGDAAEGVRLLEKAMRLGGNSCPGVEELLQAARAQLAAATAAAPRSVAAKVDPQQNGGCVEDRYVWSQTKEAVEINLFVAPDTKSKDVQVHISESHLKIAASGQVLLEGDWEFKVCPEEDADWELVSCRGQRALRLLVRKAVMPGGLSVAVWWSRILKGEPSIDVQGIEGRQRDRDKSQEFQKAWGEAHAMFREAVKNRQPIPIDVGQ
ncbi:BOB2 [Symbiodinium natans]|uniref:BOB2 protein n=1 Tax=Symbiodinium natans TaxID=878477 RepID=A0A812N573_9DINO|nr:BOB2 [Symbiodinium natans]